VGDGLVNCCGKNGKNKLDNDAAIKKAIGQESFGSCAVISLILPLNLDNS
jgi:hypothetical protein